VRSRLIKTLVSDEGANGSTARRRTGVSVFFLDLIKAADFEACPSESVVTRESLPHVRRQKTLKVRLKLLIELMLDRASFEQRT
jgi:hypothetical protein